MRFCRLNDWRNMDKVVFILGATGVGKSEIGVKLAKQFDGEIISSDSVQIFKGFDIGSAKVTENEMQGVVHHCIDICQPEEYFSVFDFVELTRKKIAEINAKGKLPIVVGGTGLYIKALTEGYNFGGTDKHDKFRAEMQKYAESEGADKLWQLLFDKNREIADKIEKNNIKRVIRALELCEFGEEQTKTQADFDYLIFALNIDRAILYDRINKRVDLMVKQGLFEEVEKLLQRGISENCQPMKAIGYKEIVEFFKGNYSKEEAIEIVKQHSRNYAKRQLTFLRGMNDVQYVDASDRGIAFKKIEDKIKIFLQQ